MIYGKASSCTGRLTALRMHMPLQKKAKEVFRPHYRLYSGALMDIIYDHFLANDSKIFSGGVLEHFTRTVYTILEENTVQLPEQFVQVFFLYEEGRLAVSL